MKETPIIYAPPMVKAILTGQKTMTRRTTGLEKINENPDDWDDVRRCDKHNAWLFRQSKTGNLHYVICPYGGVGDRLWVRETWRPENYLIPTQTCLVEYKAGGTVEKPCPKADYDKLWRTNDRTPLWRPSIHIYRWASRINQEITEVRVERLQEITIEDAFAEGINDNYAKQNNLLPLNFEKNDLIYCRHIYYFMVLWDSINAKRGYGWDKNPFVWVIETKTMGVNQNE